MEHCIFGFKITNKTLSKVLKFCVIPAITEPRYSSKTGERIEDRVVEEAISIPYIIDKKGKVYTTRFEIPEVFDSVEEFENSCFKEDRDEITKDYFNLIDFSDRNVANFDKQTLFNVDYYNGDIIIGYEVKFNNKSLSFVREEIDRLENDKRIKYVKEFLLNFGIIDSNTLPKIHIGYFE